MINKIQNEMLVDKLVVICHDIFLNQLIFQKYNYSHIKVLDFLGLGIIDS